MNSVYIDGYKGLNNLSLTDLARINYLVGPNASGKSSILECLKLFGYGLTFQINQGDFPIANLSKHSISPDGFEIKISKVGKLTIGMKIGYEMVNVDGHINHRRKAFFVTNDSDEILSVSIILCKRLLA